MMPDHYATLGVPPTAKTAAVRAAYLALMREYHPDRNSDPAATVRAQAVIEAFKVLGDFDRRNHYDWDRRREREAADAAAAKHPRRIRRGAIGAAVGLAAVGAWILMPGLTSEPVKPGPRVAEALVTRITKANPEPQRAAKVAALKRQIVRKVEPPAPARVAKVQPAPIPAPAKPKVAQRRNVQTAAAGAPAPRMVPQAVLPPPARPAKVAISPVPPAGIPAPAARGDLASLDQFVMGFYGQSWRYGDAPKRAALEQSRASFIARSTGCTGDSCKRDAYLKLMSDVSAIVESRRPGTP